MVMWYLILRELIVYLLAILIAGVIIFKIINYEKKEDRYGK